jgi:hypothetical protein
MLIKIFLKRINDQICALKHVTHASLAVQSEVYGSYSWQVFGHHVVQCSMWDVLCKQPKSHLQKKRCLSPLELGPNNFSSQKK